MNLDPKLVRAIERGAKTQLTLPVRDPKTVRRAGPRRDLPRTGQSATYIQQPHKPQAGESLVVQTAIEHENPARRKPEVRVLILDVQRKTLGDLTTTDAIAEGYDNLPDFAHHWMRKHSTNYPPQTEALCKNCEGHKHYVDHHGNDIECDECDEVGTILVDDKPSNEDILTRWQRRHAHHLVWVLEIAYQADTVRFVNRRAYLPPTTSVTEALDPEAPLLGDPRPDWRDRAEQHRQQALRDRDGARLAGPQTPEERMAELRRLAAERGVDVSKDEKYIGHRLDQMERKVRQAPTRRAA